MPEFGRRMLFPPSYYHDQYTPAEEERMEWADQRAERRRPSRNLEDSPSVVKVDDQERDAA